jgi:hypothetical protein
MKTKLFLLSLLIGLQLSAQNPICFSSPNGTDGSGWFYKDYVIPTGYKIDSIYMNATRPGYTGSNLALNMWYCPNSSSYSNCSTGRDVLAYSNFTTSMYNVWLRTDTAHVNATGMVRVNIPPDAVWSQLCIAISPMSLATINCYTVSDGTDGSGWYYKDYVIQTGYRIDSIQMTATRPGYTGNNLALNMWYCPNSTSFTNCAGGKPTLAYANFTTSMYNIWLRVDTANNVAPGMVMVNIPPDAVWSQLCIATSALGTTGIKQSNNSGAISIYPNPATDYIYLNDLKSNASIEIFDLSGQSIKHIQNVHGSIDISELEKGMYFLQISSQQKTEILKIIKE